MTVVSPKIVPSTRCVAHRPKTLIMRHLGLATAIARKYRVSGDERDDIEQVARLGLVKAAARFSSDRDDVEKAFVAYASPTIHGTIKRYLRDLHTSIRAPRRLHELSYAVSVSRSTLQAQLGCEPTPDELADSVGITRRTLEEVEAVRGRVRPLSFSAPVDGGDGSPLLELIPDPGADDSVSRLDLRISLDRASERCLTSRERLIVRLHFFEDRTQQQIGTILGISQVQVSRLLHRILAKLRTELADGREDVRKAA